MLRAYLEFMRPLSSSRSRFTSSLHLQAAMMKYTELDILQFLFLEIPLIMTSFGI